MSDTLPTMDETLVTLSQSSVDDSFVLDSGEGSQLYRSDRDRLVLQAKHQLEQLIARDIEQIIGEYSDYPSHYTTSDILYHQRARAIELQSKHQEGK